MIKNILKATVLGSLLAPMAADAGGATTAQAPTLKINGYSIVNAYMSNQTDKSYGKGGSQPHINIPVSDIYFTVFGRSASGTEYKMRVNFKALPGEGTTVNQNYLEFYGAFGTFHLGAVAGPENRMIQDGARVAGATGLFDGGLFTVINRSAGTIAGSNDMIGSTSYATKVAWYTPKVYGLQLGIAFTPNTAHQGDGKKNNAYSNNDSVPGMQNGIYPVKKARPWGQKNIAVGLLYERAWEYFSMKLSAAFLTDKGYYRDYDNLDDGRSQVRGAKSYQLGAIFGYKDFLWGIGYLNNGRSHLPKGPLKSKKVANAFGDLHLGNSGQAFNTALSYTMGAYKLSAGFQHTSRKTDATLKSRSHIFGIGLDFKALQGLNFYGEANHVKMRTNEKVVATTRALDSQVSVKDRYVGNNQGVAFITGVRLSF